MDKWVYSSIDEEVYHKTLSNGLNVYIIKKGGYEEKCAFFGTKFGSFQTGDYLVDSEGKKHLVLGGIAHFLEHRLFDYYKGNVMDLYDELGAYTNAFTSYNKTVYYFSTLDNFDECLNLLLDFPGVFEMSEEAVNKEKDIIVQELLMYKDMADQKLFDQSASGTCRAIFAVARYFGNYVSLRLEAGAFDFDPHASCRMVIPFVLAIYAYNVPPQMANEFSSQCNVARYLLGDPRGKILRHGKEGGGALRSNGGPGA